MCLYYFASDTRISRFRKSDILRARRREAAHDRAAARGGIGPGKAEPDADESIRAKGNLLTSSRAVETTVLSISSEARINELLCKLIQKHNDHLTSR